MNPLRNPWVVGVLAVVAVIVVARQVMTGGRSGGATVASTTQPSTPVADASAPAPAPDSTPAKPAPEKSAPLSIDSNYTAQHYADWAGAPRRDPFLKLLPGPEKTEKPIASLKLQAIWRQTGSSLAVINHGVYAEGDTVEGYKVEKIEDDQVWLQGSDQKERLGFAGDQPDAPAAPAPSPSVSRQ
jgi:hypothetical protein